MSRQMKKITSLFLAITMAASGTPIQTAASDADVPMEETVEAFSDMESDIFSEGEDVPSEVVEAVYTEEINQETPTAGDVIADEAKETDVADEMTLDVEAETLFPLDAENVVASTENTSEELPPEEMVNAYAEELLLGEDDQQWMQEEWTSDAFYTGENLQQEQSSVCFEVDGALVEQGEWKSVSENVQTEVKFCTDTFYGKDDVVVMWNLTLYDKDGFASPAEEGTHYITTGDKTIINIYTQEMLIYDSLEIEASLCKQDGSLLCSGKIYLELPKLMETDICEIASVRSAVTSIFSDFFLEKYIAGLYCDADNAAYYGTIQGYINGSVKSPADVVINDLNGNGSFIDTVNLWEKATFNPSNIVGDALSEIDYYEAILIAMMGCNIKSEGFNALCEAMGESYSAQIKSILSSSLDEGFILSDLLKKSTYTESEKNAVLNGLDKWLKQCMPTLSDASDIVDSFERGMSMGKTLNDLIEKMAQYVVVYYTVGDGQKELLNQMYAKCPSTSIALKRALSRLIDCCDSKSGLDVTVLQSMINTTGEIAYSKIADTFWSGLIDGTPLVVIKLSQQLTQSFDNLAFATDETVEQYYKLNALCKIEKLLHITLQSMINDYRSNSTLKNAEAINTTVNQMFSLYDVSCDYTNTFADIVMTKGLFSAAFSDKEAYRNFKNEVETLRRYAKEDQESLERNYLIFLEADYPEIFKELDIGQSSPVYVPIQAINAPKSITIDMASAFPYGLVQASVVPYNASDRMLTYISGDESILIVDSFGWVTPKKIGKTTITVSAKSGVSVTVNVTVIETVNGSGREENIGEVIDSGSCGDNVKWKLTSDGTLYIYGKGEMTNYDYYYGRRSPWYKNVNIKTVVVSEGVTGIGDHVLYDCSSLSSISLPKGLTSIGHGAFENCSSLSSINLPTSLTSIGWWALKNCSSLSSISLPEGLTSIGGWAFGNCSTLSSISLPESLTSISDYMFCDCSNLSSISLPKGLTSIGGWAFENCSNLSSISLPESLTSIGSWAFEGCSSLSSISLPEGLTSIGNRVFENCSSLSSVSLPDGLTRIGYRVFRNCSSLSNISLPEGITSIGDNAFAYCSSLSSISLPESLTSIDDYAFYSCEKLNGIKVPKSVVDIGAYALGYNLNFGLIKSFVIMGQQGSAAETYALEHGFQFSENEIPISTLKATLSQMSYVYDGTEKKPTVTVDGLLEGMYTVSYQNNINVGTATVTITGTNAYTGTKTLSFEIVEDGSQSTEPEQKPSGGESTEPEQKPSDSQNTGSEQKLSGGESAEPEQKPSDSQNTGSEQKPSGGQTTEPEKEPSAVQPVQKVTSVTVASATAAVQKGKSLQLSAKVSPANAADKSLKWTTSNSKVATVSSSGKVTGKNYGTATITAAAKDGSGKKAVCKVTVGYGLTYKLNGGTNNTKNPAAHYKKAVTLKNPTRKGYLFKGWYTDKKFKKKLTKVAASSKKNLTLYAKWEKVSVGAASVKQVKNSAGKKAAISYKKVSKAAGYQILYSTDKKFKKGCKTVLTKKTSATLKGLTKGKTYYVKVRAYRVDSTGKKVYGKYSAVKSVKIKK